MENFEFRSTEDSEDIVESLLSGKRGPTEKEKFGDWVVSASGIECKIGHYFIEYERFRKHFGTVTTWLEHLRNKTWFTPKCERNFLEAYYWCDQLNRDEGENNND